MYKYLEIIETKTKTVTLRLDVTDKSERVIDKIDSGMNINLNHAKFQTNLNESEVELPIIN